MTWSKNFSLPERVSLVTVFTPLSDNLANKPAFIPANRFSLGVFANRNPARHKKIVWAPPGKPAPS